MKTKAKIRQYKVIEKHGENLKAIFGVKTDAIKLCKQLRRLETQGEKIAVDFCNGDIDQSEFEALSESLLEKLDKIICFKEKDIPVFLNGDCRGYALKIRSEHVHDNDLNIHKDWGGFGILAPEIN